MVKADLWSQVVSYSWLDIAGPSSPAFHKAVVEGAGRARCNNFTLPARSVTDISPEELGQQHEVSVLSTKVHACTYALLNQRS